MSFNEILAIQKTITENATLKVVDKTGIYDRIPENLRVGIRELSANSFDLIRKNGGQVTMEGKKTTLNLATFEDGDALVVQLGFISLDENKLIFPGNKGLAVLKALPLQLLQQIAKEIRELSGLAEYEADSEDFLDEEN